MVRALGYKRPFADSARAVTARALVVNAHAQEHIKLAGSARAVTARALV